MQNIYRSLYTIIMLLLPSYKSNNPLFEEQVSVKVFFTATLPQELPPRSYAKGLMVDILNVGIFDSEGNKKGLIRKTYPIESSTNIDFAIILVKDKSYDIVF